MISYTKSEILSTLDKAIIDNDFFYTLPCINYKGITDDTKEKYSEVIAKYLLTHLDDFNSSISQIRRDNSYKTTTHDGMINKESLSNRKEEITAKKMFNNTYPKIGKILDYQIPLKNKRVDKAGKVDLISYNSDLNNLFLLELKIPDNKSEEEKETLLRSVLEIYTYSKQVDQEKLLNDFNLPNASIQPSVLHIEGNTAYNDYIDGASPNVIKLMEKLNIQFNYLEEKVYYSL